MALPQHGTASLNFLQDTSDVFAKCTSGASFPRGTSALQDMYCVFHKVSLRCASSSYLAQLACSERTERSCISQSANGESQQHHHAQQARMVMLR